MNKIKAWIKEYSMLIIACLILAVMVKSCGNSIIERRYEYSINKYEYVVDSLILELKNTKDTLYSLRRENDMLKGSINDYRKDKEHYIRMNNNLVNVTKNLSKRDTI
jgi:hypothetical protein